MSSSEYAIGEELLEVGLASDFQDAVRNSKVIEFTEPELEMKILKSNPNEVLVVKSTINSPKKINSVKLYSETFEE